MSDNFVQQIQATQAQRPNLNVSMDDDDDKVDAHVNISVNDVKGDETPRSNTGRYKALSRMFSRQYTPTQAPGKGFFSEKPSKSGNSMKPLTPTDENSEVQPSPQLGSPRISDTSPSSQLPEPMDEEEEQMQLAGLLGRNPTPFKHCLVLDLDETLVHSSFRPVGSCDFVLSINMDGVTHKVYVLKRPGCDEFLEEMSKYYEVVVFTAGLDKYANPLLDLLDPKKYISGRLSREHCTRRGQMYIKDMDRIGRNLQRSLIIDNSPHSYALHPFNAVPILSWFDDPNDTELTDMMPFLKDLTKVSDVTEFLDASKPWRATHRALSKELENMAASPQ